MLPDNLHALPLEELVEEHRARDRQIVLLQDEKTYIKRRMDQVEAGMAEGGRPQIEGAPTQVISPVGVPSGMKAGVPGE